MSAVPEIIERLVSVADGLARVHRYPHSDRLEAWAQRLRVNLPELQTLDGLQDAGSCQYQPASRDLPPDGVAPSAAGQGIAAVARAAHGARATIADAALQSIEQARKHAHLNAFISLATESDIAAQVDQHGALQQPADALSLLGVPVAIKDLMAVQGFSMTGGTHCDDRVRRRSDAVAVARLRNAGAVIVGTTNLHELAYGITSQNPHYGHVVNPLDQACIPGGSSGGSAAAVAANIVRASLGTDTAGSIRIPAACCGVVGFKPTYDVIPRQGAMDLGPTLDHIGPITRSVDDAALLFSVMAGLPGQLPAPLSSLTGVRIGVPRNYFFSPLSADVMEAVQATLDLMRADGAEIVPLDLPGIERSAALQFATLCSEATAVHWRRLVEQPESLGDDVRVRLEIGQLFPALWYTRAQGGRAALLAMMETAMADTDVLVTPTMRTTAPLAGAASVSVANNDMPLHGAVTSLTMPFNLTGMPALTLPCGTGARGMPVGLQVVGARYHDWRVLSVAQRVERLLDSSV
jgi:aspartyl-tRNA(Asn)/glutamyl-tRNA(Gln) amidotransferase subunit A